MTTPLWLDSPMTTTPQPPLRTLYLDGGQGLRVLQDGPALRVRQRNVCDRLYPLTRLAQVVVSGPVEWSTPALLACADMSVPVAFLSAAGELRGRISGPLAADPLLDLNLALESFLDQHDGLTRYHAWFAAKAQQARLGFVRAAGWGALRTEPQTVRKLIEQRARLYTRASQLRRFDRQVYGLLRMWAGKLLRDSKLDTERPGLVVHQLDICRDFTHILIWTIQREKLAYLKQLRKLALRRGGTLAELDWFRAVQFFERIQNRITEGFDKTLLKFHVYLLESVRHHAST
jgi:hypothetical protein